jgi:two-component sensor histidine kinase
MKTIAGIVLLFCYQLVLAQQPLDAETFRQLTTTDQRQNFLKGDNVTQMNKETFEGILSIIQEKDDGKAQFYWYYQKIKYAYHFKYSDDEVSNTYAQLVQFAKNKGYKVELIIAEFRNALNKYGNKKISEQEVYSNYLTCFEQMKNIGFQEFKRYNLEWTLNEIARNFNELGDSEKALEALLACEKNTEPRPKSLFYTLTLNLIETIYAERGDYTNAIVYAQKIYDINYKFNPTQNPDDWETMFWQGLSSLNVASYMLEMGKLKECEPYAERGYKRYKFKDVFSIPGQALAEFEALQVIIKIKLLLGKMNEVEPLLKRAEILRPHIELEKSSSYFKPLKLYQNFITYYEAKKDYTNAYRYVKLAQVLQDSLNRRNDKRKLWQIESRVKADNYQAQIKSAEEESRLQQRLRNFAILALVLFSVFAFIVYRRIKNDNKIITKQKALLEQSLGEKENLLKEIHHRVKNNLQIISGLFDKQARQTNDELARKLMKEGQDRVFSIALVHQNLYQSENLTSIEIKSYLEMLTKNIEKSQKSELQNIQLTLDVDDSVVDIDTAIPLGLILNELITNCYKYAFKDRENGEILVRFRQKDQELILGVQDNGVGLPTNFDIQKVRSLGLNLVRGLVRQINGKMDFISDSKGTSFTIYCIK